MGYVETDVTQRIRQEIRNLYSTDASTRSRAIGAIVDIVRRNPTFYKHVVEECLPLLKDRDFRVRGNGTTVIERILLQLPQQDRALSSRVLNEFFTLLGDENAGVRSNARNIILNIAERDGFLKGFVVAKCVSAISTSPDSVGADNAVELLRRLDMAVLTRILRVNTTVAPSLMGEAALRVNRLGSETTESVFRDVAYITDFVKKHRNLYSTFEGMRFLEKYVDALADLYVRKGSSNAQLKRRIEEVLAELVKIDSTLESRILEKLIPNISNTTRSKLRIREWQDIGVLVDTCRRYGSEFVEGLVQQYNLSFFGRYSPFVLAHLWNNIRTNPRAVMFIAKSDHNGALYDDQQVFSSLIRGYSGSVAIYEVETDAEINNILRDLQRRGARCSFMGFSAHGNTTSDGHGTYLTLSNRYGERYRFDPKDAETMRLMRAVLTPDAYVPLLGCSVGDPRKRNNLGTTLSQNLGEQRIVSAPEYPSPLPNLTIGGNGMDITYLHRSTRRRFLQFRSGTQLASRD